MHERAVMSGDHSFDAKIDGKYVYCFSNEHWSATTKEVSFNVHGIVYVPQEEVPSDPLEAEGIPPPFTFDSSNSQLNLTTHPILCSQNPL